jgi:hypothetical protein
MKRHALAVAVVIGLTLSTGLAQERGVAQAPGITHTPLPPSQLYPPVSTPVPPPAPATGGSHQGHQGQGHGSPPTASGGDLFLADPRTYAPRFDQPQRQRRTRRPYPTAPYAVGGYYLPFAPLPVPESSRRGTRDTRARQIDGYLRLRVTPATARVLVDSSYVGTVDEVSSRAGGLPLEPGLHRVRIEAAGFETATFEVEVVAGEFVSYVRDLASLPASPAAPVRAAAPKTFYVIPGCYAGDSPPQASRLPEGCLTANLRTVPATLSSVRPQ